jgi:hypothetical protein
MNYHQSFMTSSRYHLPLCLIRSDPDIRDTSSRASFKKITGITMAMNEDRIVSPEYSEHVEAGVCLSNDNSF